MTNTKRSKFAKVALILALLLPVYFMAAALGSKFGLWDWRTGLGTLTMTAGPWLVGIVALIAVIALIAALVRAPRKGWLMALIALAIPAGMMAMAANVRSSAADIPPVHDITTDTANPPQYSAATVAAREASDANPLRPFDVPLGQFEPWAEVEGLKDKTEAQVIAESYPDLAPIITDGDYRMALVAVEGEMREAGFSDVRIDAATNTVEGVAETFWYGFKDDVIARVAETEEGVRIDFRSTSRVGQSDLGANAKRIETLSEAIRTRLES
ncbi:DUF1499 domain-containing protein [Altererythrobacter sp. ZODW24]|uniref:DUF1499 domain-containing protein n=1 Tax=Altererythrobacter sp. ZODW24 TaxID=2185142 RepID=UPI000DF75D5B|nr:DUF1499 domain-containing protein [Altererythrobacter sp. ZODW24]